MEQGQLEYKSRRREKTDGSLVDELCTRRKADGINNLN